MLKKRSLHVDNNRQPGPTRSTKVSPTEQVVSQEEAEPPAEKALPGTRSDSRPGRPPKFISRVLVIFGGFLKEETLISSSFAGSQNYTFDPGELSTR
jgi:hypothetical protein